MPSAPKKSGKKLTTSEQLELYRLLIESVQDYAIFLLDTEGHIASWNPGAEKFKGYKPHEIIGKHFSVFYAPVDIRNKKPERELEISLAEGRVEDEGWRVRKDGTRFWANVVITALYDEKGRHRGFAKVTRDLTERKQFEDNLFQTNRKLHSSYVELKALSAAKDEFVSLASHQLRTPATGVKQYLNLLLEGYAGPLSELQRDYLQKAYNSNDRQIEIVNDLLNVARVDAGKVVLAKARTDINTMLIDIVDEQIDSFKKRKQAVRLDLTEDAIIAYVDPVRLRMVLENIIDNASKYTAKKGKIIISAAEEDKEVKIKVEDTGIGISKAEQAKLFEKFSRIQNRQTKNVSGSGLGLYWADKIIKLHGGRIEVESRKGKGSTFTVCIPKEEIHG